MPLDYRKSLCGIALILSGCSSSSLKTGPIPLPPVDRAVGENQYQRYRSFEGVWAGTLVHGETRSKISLVLNESRFSEYEAQKMKARGDISPSSGILTLELLAKRNDPSCGAPEEVHFPLTGNRVKDTVYLFNVFYSVDDRVPDSGGVTIPSSAVYVRFKWPQTNPDEMTIIFENATFYSATLGKEEIKLKRVAPEAARN
jgi:hypothetical protein